jgi:hypothetical protein
MKRLAVYILIACISWTTASQATENLITNGSFEVPHACNCRLGPGADLGGWQIDGPAGYTVTPFWEYPYTIEGFQDLYLKPGGSISQALPSNDGYYELRGYAGASWDTGPTNLEVSSASRVVGSMIVPAPRPPNFTVPFYWYEFEFEFFAQANERLTLRAFGPTVILDDLKLVEVPVPEPSSLALVGLAIIGLTGRGFNRRRRAHAGSCSF